MERLERLDEDEERDWIRRAREGDPAARAELVRRFEGPLQSYLDRKVGPRLGRAVSLSDLCQETFLQALDALRVLPPDATFADFRGVLFRHALWMVGKQAEKHRGFQGESVLGGGGTGAGPESPARSEGEVTRHDEAEWLRGLVERLEPERAAVIRLRLEGLSFSEIAGRLEIREGAARQRYLRGSRELRALAEAETGRADQGE